MVMYTIKKRHGQKFSKLAFVFGYVFFRKSRRVFLNNFILKLFISNYVKKPSESDGYFEGYPLFTICCGCSAVISKNMSSDCRYNNYTFLTNF